MSTLGLHSLAFMPLWNPMEARQLLPGILEHGVGVIETPLLDPANYDSLGSRSLIESLGIRIVCSLGLPLAVNVLKRTQEAIDYLDFAMNVARNAGAECLTGVIYGTIGQTSKSPPTSAERDAICRLVDSAARRASALNMRLGLEPCNRYETHLLNTARQATEVIERVGAENVFVHLDSYHMNIEEEGMAAGFADAGEHLGYVHLSESNRGVPGRGTMDWQGTFEGLKSVGYDGDITLESFVYLAPEIASGLAIWRPVTDQPKDVIDVGLPFIRNLAAEAGLTLES